MSLSAGHVGRHHDLPGQGTIEVDVAAVRHNVRTLLELLHAARPDRPAELIAIVKADGYGHGMVACARAARDAGASWVGVATMREALALRAAGDDGPLVCWLPTPGGDFTEAVRAGIDVTAHTADQVSEIAVAAAAVGRPARLQLKIDTGLSRAGVAREGWPDLVAAAVAARESGQVEVTGLWSHFAASDWPHDPANDAQEAAFAEAVAVADRAGLGGVRHLCNSAATLLRPSAHYDAVRPGLALYGLDPAPEEATVAKTELRPAMRVTSRLALVKRIAAGEAVSYGHTWVAPTDTWIGLVPVGYADGIPRAAGNRAEVTVDGVRRAIRGVICMDQFVIDLGPDRPGAIVPRIGEEVVILGNPVHGEPAAQEWAQWCETISYEIVTRLGGRFERRWIDSDESNSGHPKAGTAETQAVRED